MAHFAKIEDGVVTQVIAAEQDFIDAGHVGNPADWVQTSFNTQENNHLLGGTPMRGNFAGVGYTYDAENDVFIPPKHNPSWVINTATWTWIPPLPYPGGSNGDGKRYIWDEASVSWQEYVTPEEEVPVEVGPIVVPPTTP